jgi:ElaB/YqjD/DUF883 family membrane-anchored ribosome-binding protein
MDDYTKQPGDAGYVPSESTGSGAGTAATRSKISEKAGEIRDKVTELGRRAVESVDNSRQSAASALDTTASTLHSGGDRLSGAAHSAAEKIQATADYVRQTDLRGMGQEVTNLVKRYPGQSLAVAAVLGFLVARSLRSND